ncbi:apolipoprotein N-acyltransferase [Campylobacter sp. CCUG 57310]|uniref:apolipoprotein N-acyltransferase n=1 Tax=Campylobacter sp. CCUG 57310 TaxID=2517362 RepID=UPI001565BC4C|nr:apolipoprotein N-acyltransferase [Campylobacter sp. CCUG 57310]QKF91927.1 apolipoprotein N-acyltransferase [Campylobacter sp. CCUG 57310]
MKLKNCLLALYSLVKNFLIKYFSTKIIRKAFFSAFLISNFIFLSLFDSEVLNFVSPFLAILGFYLLFNFNRYEFFTTGFFVGILWFYWISFSLIYYNFGYLIPIEILFIGIVYGVMFFIAGIPTQIWLKAVLLILISNLHPFNFNWLNFEAIFVVGIFKPNLYGFVFVFAAILSLFYIKTKLKFLACITLLLFAVQYDDAKAKILPFEVTLTNTNVPQALKWEKSLKNEFINENLKMIDEAINEGKRAIIMPESVFPTFMTQERNLTAELKEKSQKIAIVAGALAYENSQSYNSTFFFDKGEIKRFDKLVLVPFGEEILLPNFMKNLINELFFDGGKDFKTANSVSDYEIDGVKIRNAICYEATRDELFKGEFDVMIAITNNGWFVPSTEPNLQRLLLKYYSTKYNKTIYHSVNGSPSEIITPKRGLLDKFLSNFY